MKCTYIVLEGENKNYVATVPEYPGIVTQSKDKDELESRIKEATIAYLNTLKREKMYVPKAFKLVEVKEVEIQYE